MDEPKASSDGLASQTYPRNLTDRRLAPYTLDAISQQLHMQASRLFSDEAGAALDFLDLGTNAEGVWNIISWPT
jgi:hypothetical protein